MWELVTHLVGLDHWLLFFFCGSIESGSDIGLLLTVTHDAFFTAFPHWCAAGSFYCFIFVFLFFFCWWNFVSVKYSSTSVCMVCEVSLKKKLVTHFCFAFWYSHFSSESDVIPALYFTNRMGFLFENNRYRTMRLLSHPVIIFLCSRFSLSLYFFPNRGNCSGRIHRNLRTCMDRESEDQQPAHYQGIIMQPIYTCSLQG